MWLVCGQEQVFAVAVVVVVVVFLNLSMLSVQQVRTEQVQTGPTQQT